MTTFVTMAYIILVNPQILGDAGMDKGATLVATCLASAAATLFMGLYANYPFALAPGMGLNAFFAYTLAPKIGWPAALGCVLLSGLCAVLVTLTGLRETLIRAIPASLKHAVAAGIGLFIALIGLKNAGIVVSHPVTFVDLGDFHRKETLLSAVGLFLTAGLLARKVRGGMLLGILLTAALGVPFGITQIPENWIAAPPSLAPTFLKLDLKAALQWSLAPVIFSLFFADLFDTLGTFVGVASRTGMLDAQGRLKRGGRALFADALGTVVGSLLGTSNTTTYVESASGVACGGRTGLTSVVVAALFLASTVFAPLALAVPKEATAPALILVGIFMAGSLAEIRWSDFSEAFPAFLTAVLMPLTFSISQGLAIGFIAFALVNLLAGRARTTHPLMYVLAVFFALYYAFVR